MGIVQVVGRADGDIVNLSAIVSTAAHVNMTVEALKLRKKVCIRKVAVDDANRVVGVKRCNQIVAGGFDGLHVARGYVTGGADECEIFHVFLNGLQTEDGKADFRRFVAVVKAFDISQHRQVATAQGAQLGWCGVAILIVAHGDHQSIDLIYRVNLA